MFSQSDIDAAMALAAKAKPKSEAERKFTEAKDEYIMDQLKQRYGGNPDYKDIKADEFWVRGHMPGYPLMPGVLMSP